MNERKTIKQRALFQLVILAIIILLVNVIASVVYNRFDLTKEKRYTLSDATKNILEDLDDIVYIKVYLEGDFPAGFKRLRNETNIMLDEFRSYANGRIEYEFIEPFENADPKQRQDIYKELLKKGLKPTNLKIKGDDDYSEKIIFPGALFTYNDKELPLELLQNQVGLGPQANLNNSISSLEYGMASVIRKLQLGKKQQIAFIHGHGELSQLEVSDLVYSLSPYYDFAIMDLRKYIHIPDNFTAIIIAKPRSAFPEKDKFKIDQYIMNGGRVLWLVEALYAEMDSFKTGNTVFTSVPLPLNLEDQLFKYGVRINANLIQDYRCLPIPINAGPATGAPQFEPKEWPYFPVILSSLEHPIVKNLDAIVCRFVGSLDTVGAKNIKKSILLRTSEYSRLVSAPARINLNMVHYKPTIQQFNKSNQNIAVLLEGEFESVFKNRISQQFTSILQDSLNQKFRTKSKPTKMIVVSDGDMIRNDVGKDGNYYPLGYDRYLKQTFSNKDFLVNAIEYLCDNSGIIEARTKEVKLRLLDRAQIKKEKLKWQLINMLAPIVLLAFFGMVYNFIRIRKYTF